MRLAGRIWGFFEPFRTLSPVVLIIFLLMISFIAWTAIFKIDQVVKSTGRVIATSRVQIIQAIEPGALSELLVREGDHVVPGQLLAKLDQTRFEATTQEVQARVSALRAKTARLRAEVTQRELVFPDLIQNNTDMIAIEKALYDQRLQGLTDDLRGLQIGIQLAREESAIIEGLAKTGDVDRAEVIRSQRAINEAESKFISRRNQYFEQAGAELTKAEDELSQSEQVLLQRQQQLIDSTFRAVVPGEVKNIKVTTIGGVLRQGDELMQIVPTDDELIVESKILPQDISDVREGLTAKVRFDAYDSSVHGTIAGNLIYLSADTIRETTPKGEETYYAAHIKLTGATTSVGKKIDILPGMTAQVDIKTGQRSILTYLLKPISKTFDQAFGEK